MKRIFAILAVALSFAVSVSAQVENRKLDFDEDTDFFLGKGALKAEPLSYFAFGDHQFFNATDNFDQIKGKANTEFLFNIFEIGLKPYPTGMFSVGVDLAWNYFRLDSWHYWLPDASKQSVSIATMENSGIKTIKKSRLSVRTIGVPVTFEQSFGSFDIRIGAIGEYNFPAVSKFRGVDKDGSAIKETKSGTRFSNGILTNTFTYSFFGAVSFGGMGMYLKYRPTPQIQEGHGPQFQTLTIGVITGLGM